jgi:PAS domain S-box-containing protein
MPARTPLHGFAGTWAGAVLISRYAHLRIGGLARGDRNCRMPTCSSNAELTHPPAPLESLLERPSDAGLVVNESGTILFASDPACDLFKYAAGELHGRSVELLIPVRNRLAHIGQRIRFTDDRRTRPMAAGLVLFALCKDGSERRVDISLNPVRKGLETLIVAIIRVHKSD